MTWQINLSTPPPLNSYIAAQRSLDKKLHVTRPIAYRIIIKVTILRHIVATITSLICHGNYGLQNKSTLLGWLDLPQATVA